MTDTKTNTETAPLTPAQQRAELARACNDQLAARQSKALEAANLKDIAAAETADRDTGNER